MNIILKRNDKGYAFTYPLVNEDGSVVDLTGASVVFNMGDKSNIILTKPATIVNASTGTVSYTFTEADTLMEGNFIAEFVVTTSTGNKLTYPRTNYLVVNIMSNVDSNETNITLDSIANKQGDFESKLESILKQTGNLSMSAINDYTWSASDGQLRYTMPVGANYDANSKWFEVQIGGIPVDPNLIVRNTSNQFTLLIDSSLVQAGMLVRAKWTEPIVPVTSGHHAVHEKNGSDEIDITKLLNYQEQIGSKLNGVINVMSYGVTGDGITDDSDFIIAAENAAFSLGGDIRLRIPYGIYKITKKIKFRCSLDAEQATFKYYGNGTAIVLGDDSATGIVTARKQYRAPRVINMNRTTGWDGTSEGIKTINLNACDVYIPFVQDFEKGLIIYGYSQGNAYNNYFIGALWENHKNLVLDGDATSWVNQNQFFGGRLQQSISKGATLDDANANQIDMSSSIQPNNNTFFGTSLEGENVAYYRVEISGRHNIFYNCRWEAMNGSIPRIKYRSTAYSNKIDGGYNLVNVVEAFDAGAVGGEIKDSAGAYLFSLNTSGQSIPTGVNTKINTWNSMVSRRINYDSSTGDFTPRAGRWKISATACFAPNATGRRFMLLVCNGATRDVFETPANANRASMKVEDVYYFNGTQTFSIQVNQSSGANLALETTSGYVKVQAEYLGY